MIHKDERMRVLFVGDSMTVGAAGDFTWRYRMWQHLCRTYGGPFRIVGPRTTLHDPADDMYGTDGASGDAQGNGSGSDAYADPAFPAHARAHLAGWGEGWQHLAPLIGDTVRTHTPDTLLVSLGLIDLGFYSDAGQTVTHVERFFAEARAAAPELRAVLLPVIPNIRAAMDPGFGTECARFNELLAKAVADLSEPRSPLLLASPPYGWDLDRDTYDGTHPSPEGEHRLAECFAEALHQAWAVGGPYARADERGGTGDRRTGARQGTSRR